MDKQKLFGTILGVILFILLIAGVTYAYLTWTSDRFNYKVSSKCFDVLYTKGTDISGAIMPSTSYTGGLSTTIKMNINSSCNIKARGKLYLNTNEETSSNLYRTGLLNYQVLKGSTVISGGSGSITESGEIEIDLGELTSATSATTSYKLYVWIDYNLVENSDAFSAYSGSIRAEAIQFE